MSLVRDLTSIVNRYYQGNIPLSVQRLISEPHTSLTPGATRALVDAFQNTFKTHPHELRPPLEKLLADKLPHGISRREWAKAQVIAMKTHDIPTAPTPDLWETNRYIENDAKQLNEILEAVCGAVQAGQRPVIVFDLDDTLQPTRPRELRIFHEYAREQGIPRLLGMQMGHIVGWDLNHMLVDLMQFHPAWAKVHAPLMRQHWNPRFFSNEYLANDPAFDGAADYVNALHAAGATIIYVTGRDSIDMQTGTIESLRKNGFPVPTVQDLNGDISTQAQQVLLFMKPISNQQIVAGVSDEKERTSRIKASDVDYKKRVMEILKQLNIIASFENEPGNANAFRENLPGRVLLIRTKAANAALTLIGGVEEFRSWRRSD